MSVLKETAKFLYKTGLCRFFLIERRGLKLRFHPTRISKRLWIESFRGVSKNDAMDRFFIDYLRRNDCVVDIGANIGWYTLLSARQVGDLGLVFAFEAHPKTFDYLTENIKLNQLFNVQLYETALGNESGQVQFSDEYRDDMNRVVEDHGISVTMSKLDHFPLVDRIDLIKIDVEGFELFVLQGAMETLGRTEVVIFEYWQQHATPLGYSFSDIHRLFDRLGFTLLAPEGSRFVQIDEHFQTECLIDIIAVQNMARFRARMHAR